MFSFYRNSRGSYYPLQEVKSPNIGDRLGSESDLFDGSQYKGQRPKALTVCMRDSILWVIGISGWVTSVCLIVSLRHAHNITTNDAYCLRKTSYFCKNSNFVYVGGIATDSCKHLFWERFLEP